MDVDEGKRGDASEKSASDFERVLQKRVLQWEAELKLHFASTMDSLSETKLSKERIIACLTLLRKLGSHVPQLTQLLSIVVHELVAVIFSGDFRLSGGLSEALAGCTPYFDEVSSLDNERQALVDRLQRAENALDDERLARQKIESQLVMMRDQLAVARDDKMRSLSAERRPGTPGSVSGERRRNRSAEASEVELRRIHESLARTKEQLRALEVLKKRADEHALAFSGMDFLRSSGDAESSACRLLVQQLQDSKNDLLTEYEMAQWAATDRDRPSLHRRYSPALLALGEEHKAMSAKLDELLEREPEKHPVSAAMVTIAGLWMTYISNGGVIFPTARALELAHLLSWLDDCLISKLRFESHSGPSRGHEPPPTVEQHMYIHLHNLYGAAGCELEVCFSVLSALESYDGKSFRANLFKMAMLGDVSESLWRYYAHTLLLLQRGKELNGKQLQLNLARLYPGREELVDDLLEAITYSGAAEATLGDILEVIAQQLLDGSESRYQDMLHMLRLSAAEEAGEEDGLGRQLAPEQLPLDIFTAIMVETVPSVSKSQATRLYRAAWERTVDSSAVSAADVALDAAMLPLDELAWIAATLEVSKLAG